MIIHVFIQFTNLYRYIGGSGISEIIDRTKKSGAISDIKIIPDTEFCYHIHPTKILDLIKSKETCAKIILSFFFDLIEKRLIFEFFEKPYEIIAEFWAHIPENYKAPAYLYNLKSKIQELVSDFLLTRPAGDEPFKEIHPIFGITGPEYIDHKMVDIILEILGGYAESESA